MCLGNERASNFPFCREHVIDVADDLRLPLIGHLPELSYHLYLPDSHDLREVFALFLGEREFPFHPPGFRRHGRKKKSFDPGGHFLLVRSQDQRRMVQTELVRYKNENFVFRNMLFIECNPQQFRAYSEKLRCVLEVPEALFFEFLFDRVGYIHCHPFRAFPPLTGAPRKRKVL